MENGNKHFLFNRYIVENKEVDFKIGLKVDFKYEYSKYFKE
jgi:hypothetical protein